MPALKAVFIKAQPEVTADKIVRAAKIAIACFLFFMAFILHPFIISVNVFWRYIQRHAVLPVSCNLKKIASGR